MYQGFCDEHGAESRTAKELVARNEKVDAAFLEHEALPYPPYLDRVFPVCKNLDQFLASGTCCAEDACIESCHEIYFESVGRGVTVSI